MLFLHFICSCIFMFNCFSMEVLSPDGKLKLKVDINSKGRIYYSLNKGVKAVILPSSLGIVLEKEKLIDSFLLKDKIISSFDENWNPVLGEVSVIRNNYNQLHLYLQSKKNEMLLEIIFRLFNDGLGFRYVFAEQNKLTNFIIKDEISEFNLQGDPTVFWMPGDNDMNEYYYTISKMSKIDTKVVALASPMAAQSYIGKNYLQTPLMIKSDNGLYINIHEASLVDYPAMELKFTKSNLTSYLIPDVLGNKAYLQTPAKTPWRTIIVGDSAVDILHSKLILNLNDPCVYPQTDWIKPIKYIGIWWAMFIGRGAWSYSDKENVKIDETDWKNLVPHNKHAANTKNALYHIDFAKAHGFDAVLIEGWNVGWEDWFLKWKDNVFDFVTPYPDFDVAAISDYAKKKGIQIIMHHETSSSVMNYERRLQDAISFMKKYGYQSVKTGYVGPIIPRGEHHYGQMMINHYLWVAKELGKNQMLVNAHESVRPTGLHRTYPNWIASESGKGTEYKAWGGGDPRHETILPFTRLMGGPMDYTPGILQNQFSYYDQKRTDVTKNTIAKELALYVTMYSPLQMAADLPENYERYAKAFQFIKDVALDWEQSIYLDAEPGEFIFVARKQKNSSNWFIGGITNEKPRKFNVKLDFLDKDITYEGQLYLDGDDAHYLKNPASYKVLSKKLTNQDVLSVDMAPGGGFAVSIKL